MSGYIGNIPTPQATQTRDTFTATSGQTTFATSGYTPNFVLVWLNGVLLQEGTDYTASNGSDVVLTTGAASGDTLEVVAYSTFQLADQTFTGDFSVDSPTFVVDSTNNRVGIGTTSPVGPLEVESSTNRLLTLDADSVADFSMLSLRRQGTEAWRYILESNGDLSIREDANLSAEVMRIKSADGDLLIGTDNDNPAAGDYDGIALKGDGNSSNISVDGTAALVVNRRNSDGNLITFRQAGNIEGTITVSGSTVSYNGGHLSRWSQTADDIRIDGLLKGTVMTNLDQMAVWDEEDNEQLNCMAVSSVEGDPNVAGVFVNWDDDDEIYTADMNIAMTGDMIIRIGADVTVERGDLLMSAGDGTAKPQEDDIVRSKTIAKVTSTHVTCTYDDGSYCVPCVLMAC